MPSVVVLRAVLAASLGLGVVDVVWINIALVPDVTHTPPSPRMTVTAVAVPAPARPPEPAPEPAPAPATEPPAPTLAPRTVYFATRSAALDDTAHETLRALAAALPTDAAVVLEGHADHRGDEWLNRRLSKERALAVARQLAELGIAQTRVRIRYLGETQAMHTAPLDEVWRDRRVDIEIIPGGTR